MTRDIRNTLKNNTPEFLKTYPELVSFLDAAGSFLNETKDAIEGFDYSHDYQFSSENELANRLNSLGFQLPPFVDEHSARLVLRDAIDIYIRKGTTDSLEWVLRLIGTTPTIKQTWLPSPKEVRKGQKVNLDTGGVERYDVSGLSYTDFLYGDAVRTESGTFFQGYKYQDIFEENLLTGFPIIGENYTVTPEYLTPVEKLPYVSIRITDEDFNVATEPYTDPETGVQYEYGLNETYRALASILEYFLYDTVRPVNTRILIISSLQVLEETVGLSEYFEQTTESDFTPDQDNFIAVDSLSENITGDISNSFIGDPLFIGRKSPYTSQFLQLPKVLDIGESGSFSMETVESFTAFSVVTLVDTEQNKSYPIPVYAGMQIRLTSPVGEQITIFGLEDFFDAMQGQVIGAVNSGEEKTIDIPLGFHGIYLQTNNNDLDGLELEIIYN